MVRDTESGVLKPDRFYDSLLKVIPELDQLAEIQVEIPFLFDSSDMDLGHWETLGRVIADHIPGVDGVVITHGTDMGLHRWPSLHVENFSPRDSRSARTYSDAFKPDQRRRWPLRESGGRRLRYKLLLNRTPRFTRPL